MAGSSKGRNMAGKVVVVTGAANGQGAAEVELLAHDGAHVYAVDIAEPEGALPRGARFVRFDVADGAAWEDFAARLEGDHGCVDGLVNNAAVAGRLPLTSTTVEDVMRVIDVNLTAPLLAMRALTPLMGPGAAIVNIGTLASLGANPGPYTVSKYGLRGLSRVASLEYGARGIRVNMVHPGLIDTKIVAGLADDRRATAIGMTAIGRIGQPDDVAPLVLFLLSDDASYISGVEIPVDGGRIAHGGGKGFADVLAAGQ